MLHAAAPLSDDVKPPDDLETLCVAICATRPGIVLVPSRILRRVIKLDSGIRALGLQVPHEHCYTVSLQRLRSWVDARELALDDEALPDDILLLPEPVPEALLEASAPVVLTRYWRLIFHGLIDQALDGVTLERDAVLERIAAIGHTEFDEIRAVLRQEHRVLPPGDDRVVWREFVALWLELRHFAPEQLPEFFPALEDGAAVDALVARDVDVTALLAAARPADALEPARLRELAAAASARRDDADSLHDEHLFDPQQLVSEASVALGAGNLVRAAILKVRGVATGRLPPAEDADEQPGDAELRSLAHTLSEALGQQGPGAGQWLTALRPVLARCRRGRLRQEVRLLFDLQRVATDYTRPTSTTDVTGWVFSLGQRAVRRQQPARERVNRVRFLRRARDRVRKLRLAEADVRQLTAVLDEAGEAAEAALRDSFEPRLRQALLEVGLEPQCLPERTARDKLVTELLDQLVERGFLDLGSLRDGLSRNQLKLGDLNGPGEFLRGDPLLRLDRCMAEVLDGVYRRGEVYLRGLQRVSSLAFATRLGRWLVLFAVLPFGAAFVALEGLQHIVGPVVGWLGATPPKMLTPLSFGLLGVYLLALIHLPGVRRGSHVAARALWRGLQAVFVDAPRWLVQRPLVQRVLESWPVRALRRLVVRPAIAAALVWWIVPLLGAPPGLSVLAGITLFIGAAVLLNSPLGAVLEEHLIDHAARSWRQLRHRLIPGLLRWIVDFFDRMVDRFERLLYAVDEHLRYRRGESAVAFALKASVGVVWAGLTWLARVYVTLLIEPQVNPIKHFPVVTVSHKIILPFTLTLTQLGAQPLAPLLGPVIANAIVGFTVFLLPGVFGFLVWEFKENWRLYRANRPRHLDTVRVGSHGETMLQLMRPGFHSGTLPKLFARMRRAERGRRGQRDARALRKLRLDLHHIEHAVAAFVEREMLAVLEASATAGAPVPRGLRVAHVSLASNRVRVDIGAPTDTAHDDDDDTDAAGPLRIAFEEQSGALVAGVYAPGWVDALDTARRERVEIALGGLYARAGVDYVRQQLAAALPRGARYDISSERGLEVWLPGEVVPWLYDLAERPSLVPRAPHGEPPPEHPAPTLDARRVTFGLQRITWSQWTQAWSGERGALETIHVLAPAERH